MKNKYRKIWIKWHDSHGFGSNWRTANETQKLCETGPMICESTGFLIYEDDVQLCYVDSLSFNDDGDVHSSNGLSGIPISCILDWKWLS